MLGRGAPLALENSHRLEETLLYQIVERYYPKFADLSCGRFHLLGVFVEVE